MRRPNRPRRWRRRSRPGRDAEHAAEKAYHVEDAGSLAHFGHGHRTRGSRSAPPASPSRRRRRRGSAARPTRNRPRPGDAIIAIQPRPIACINSPVTTSGRSPNLLTTAPATGAVTNSVAVHGSKRSPAPKRAEAERDLQELRQQEQHAIHRGIEQEACGHARCEGSRCEQPHRHHRRGCAQFPGDEAAANSRPTASAPITSALVHPTALPRNRLQTSASAAIATSRSPVMSSAAAGPESFRAGACSTSAIATSADRQVDPEDPAPAECLGDQAADGGADDQRQNR